jgi:hypothetical protein
VADEKRIMLRIDEKSRANGYDGYMLWCPGCKFAHVIYTKNAPGKPVWKFDGNEEKPTFEPSLLCTWGDSEPTTEKAPVRHVCHSFIRDGQWQFLGDCTHELANKTVPLEPFPL